MNIGPYTVDERVITFDKQAMPKSGHLVVLVGGSGVGKSFVLKNVIPITGKVFNPDLWIEMAAKTKGLDLKDPEATSELHKTISPRNKAFMKSFLETLGASKKPNVILDSTGRSLIGSVLPLLPDMKKRGYKTTLVYVFADKSVAWQRNLQRDRVVPKEIFDKIHDTIGGIVKTAQDAFDNVWYVDSSLSTPRFWATNPERIMKVK